MDIVLASRNRRKAAELVGLLAGLPVTVRTLEEFPGVAAAVEDGLTFADNAVKKAVHAARATGLPALADDSGLEVDALGGEPGVRSARYAGEGAVDEALLFHDREAGGQPDAVVRAERRAVGLDPFALDRGPDGVLGEIVGDVGVLVADHVHVTLENDAGGALATRRGLLADDDVADLVLLGFETEARGRGQDVLGQGLLVPGTVGNAADLLEISPEVIWFQTAEGG